VKPETVDLVPLTDRSGATVYATPADANVAQWGQMLAFAMESPSLFFEALLWTAVSCAGLGLLFWSMVPAPAQKQTRRKKRD
jgi:hypothetical protein